MAQLDQKFIVRKLKLETPATNSTASSTNGSPTYGNGSGGAVHPPVSNGRAFQMDGYKPSTSKRRPASPRPHGDSGSLAGRGEGHVSTPPIAVPSTPSRGFD